MMSKVAKVTIGMAIGFIVLLIGLWLTFVRAPSPQEICDHKIQLALQELDSQGPAAQALLERLSSQCVAEKQRILQLRGKIFYARHAKCVMKAKSFTASDRC